MKKTVPPIDILMRVSFFPFEMAKIDPNEFIKICILPRCLNKREIILKIYVLKEDLQTSLRKISSESRYPKKNDLNCSLLLLAD